MVEGVSSKVYQEDQVTRGLEHHALEIWMQSIEDRLGKLDEKIEHGLEAIQNKLDAIQATSITKNDCAGCRLVLLNNIGGKVDRTGFKAVVAWTGFLAVMSGVVAIIIALWQKLIDAVQAFING